jgi:hypothetical protein
MTHRATDHALRCRCGALQGHLAAAAPSVRAICYCKDCQAFARFLATPGIVDEAGGTEVVASLPHHVAFTGGIDRLACMSLSERGLLRWYASCCNTPVGNTPRNPKIPYIGLIHNVLEAGSKSIDDSFGSRCIAVNTKSALREVRPTPFASTAAVLSLMMSALGSRVRGTYKESPFFHADTQEPIRPIRVLSAAERETAYRRDV